MSHLDTRPLPRLGGFSPQIFWLYLLLVMLAEMLTSIVSPTAGLIAHILLMAGLLVHGGIGRTESERRLALSLSLAPMIRLLSLSLPLINFPQQAWFPLVSVPLLVATWTIVRQSGISRKALGLRVGNPLVQLSIAGLGLGLGVTEYAILRPQPLVAELDWTALIVAALSLAIFTGLNEEIIFRGLMQSSSITVLGKSGLLYVALLFGVLHIGYLSVLDVVFVTSVGVLFGYIVRWTGSILGVTLAHGATNITLFLVMPHLARLGSNEAISVAVWVALSATVASAIAVGWLWLNSGPRGNAPISNLRGKIANRRGVQVLAEESL